MDGFNIAVKYLRGKSHTVKEVKEHLLSKEIDESDVKETIIHPVKTVAKIVLSIKSR